MFNRLNHRVYATPTMLFLFLTILFVLAGIYIQKDEKIARITKAQSVAEQVKISLEVFSTERIQAIHNLMLNWPSFEPNKVDWFNAQAVSIMGMQKGFSSLVYIDEKGIIKWVATPSTGTIIRINNSLMNLPVDAVGLAIPRLSESFESTLLFSDNTQHHHILIGRAISPQEPEHGFVVAGFDVQTILGVMLGELVGPQFNFELTAGDNSLFKSGEFVNDGTVVSLPPFPFIERQLVLSMQSQRSPYNPGMIIIVIGSLMSAMMSYVLHKQLKAALKLSVSQQRYLTASEASLDALLIYQPTKNDFSLVEANSYSHYLFRGACEALRDMSLNEQTRFLGLQDVFHGAANVAGSGVPFEANIAVTSDKIASEWLKIQIVKASDNIAITVRDVTERFRAQQDLERSKEKYRRLVDGMHRHFVYTKTAGHDFVYVSAGIEKILGFNAEAFCRNESSYVLQVPDEIFNIRQTLARGDKPEPYLIHYRDKQGKNFILEFSDTPILDEQGTLVAVEGIAKDVTNEIALQDKVYFQANHDQLTGLLNRYAFDAQLRTILKETREAASLFELDSNETNVALIDTFENRKAKQSVMCFIDMDRFKLVNDSCGHPAGDKLLKEVSAVFKQYVSNSDLLARIGGDEFCIIFRNQSLRDVTKRLDKLLVSISSYRFVYDDKLFFVGASIGVTEINEKTKSAEALIRAADNACYKAKHLGRNRYFVFRESDSQMDIDDTENQILQALHRALQTDGFELYSQAIMPLSQENGEQEEALQHYEILLRLNSKDTGLISPGLFIPLAERHGLMNKVDLWVIENTLHTLELNPEHVNNVGKVAINLSGITLGDEMALQKITLRIQDSTIPAEKLCFEITETTAVTNLNAAKAFISTLTDIGCCFALDDFGVGMSSFTYLKNLDVDYVKIDGSFVQNIVHDPIDHATVTAINNIAHSMGKKTVAEFVVDAATTDVLRKLKVDYGQGFALDKPKPLATRVQWQDKLASA